MKDLTPERSSLDPIEIASRDEITALQTERLKWSLAHAYDHVPHYRQSFDAAGVHPSDLRDLSDLARFPFTQKADLRANYPFGMFAVPRNQVARIHASSGTTGQPTVVGYTQNDLANWGAVVARSLRASGLRRRRPGRRRGMRRRQRGRRRRLQRRLPERVRRRRRQQRCRGVR